MAFNVLIYLVFLVISAILPILFLLHGGRRVGVKARRTGGIEAPGEGKTPDVIPRAAPGRRYAGPRLAVEAYYKYLKKPFLPARPALLSV